MLMKERYGKKRKIDSQGIVQYSLPFKFTSAAEYISFSLQFDFSCPWRPTALFADIFVSEFSISVMENDEALNKLSAHETSE